MCTQVRKGVVLRADGENFPTELRISGREDAATNGALLDNGDEITIIREVTSQDDIPFFLVKAGRKCGFIRAEHISNLTPV